MNRERPILFSGPMVLAILEGRKTMTRRVITPQPVLLDRRWEWDTKNGAAWADTIVHPSSPVACGACPWTIGQGLWVRETFAVMQGVGVKYRADNPNAKKPSEHWDTPWNPSIFMSRRWSRITLEVTGVKVERVQDIRTLTDIPAEGINDESGLDNGHKCSAGQLRGRFRTLWDSLNAKRGFGWDKNPWVWVVTFRRV